jgi:hypothetical protein
MRPGVHVNLSRIALVLRRSLALGLGLCSIGAGYVQELGPPALRWKAPKVARFELLCALPPLDMGKKSSLADGSTNQAPVTVSTNYISGFDSTFGHALTNGLGDLPAPAPGLPYDARGLLSPEWLATIFYTPQRTNGIGTLMMPVPFVPPPAMQSSSASLTRGAQ